MINLLGISFNIKLIIYPIIYIILGVLVFKITKNIIDKSSIMNKNLKAMQLQRINTLKILFTNLLKYLIVIFVVLSILSLYGLNVKSLITGLGIGTAIIGLAFQDLAKDLIAGISIITEGSYEIGDIIEVDGFRGEVIFIGLRTTRIKDYKGATKIIANHFMNNIINYSESNSLAVVDVSIAYECKEENIEEAFKKLFENIKGKIPFAVKEPELWGVNELSDSSVIYRIVVETEPAKNFSTERFLRKEIKKTFDNAKIKIPYQQIEVHNGK